MPGFRDIVGHESTIGHLKTAIASGHVSHAYLLVGDKGMGKRTLAEAYAEALQCETLREELDAGSLPPAAIDSCGECRSCRQAETGNQPDIIVWNYQKESSISVDDVRDLVSDIQIKPYASRYKIYILPDTQKMTKEAQNALLKTLEEPPEYAVLLLLTISQDAMLETIRSRCIVLPLRPVKPDMVKQYLMEKHGVPDYQAEIGAAFAQGNIGKAAALVTSEDFYDRLRETVRILENVRAWKVSDIISMIRSMDDDREKNKDKARESVNDMLDLFTIWYRDVLYFKATSDPDGIIFREQIVKIREAASRSSYDGIQTILDAVKTAKVRLRANVNFDLTMELLLLTMQEN